ncbi:DUF1800 domain-containing protein [Fulvimonas soli]|uniref:Uncharacterized protein (DUF1800 family) n=1 Tax=Fulvimonas soli TaxID=155197 RepID=A0A316IQ55_9GAMM|nr:DUF1800 domain-containing protein [Fulvimonas soli]PWK92698.1 uncharacterized protein (DUF1800 family) [Fulvimonas soli]TNY27133.1 hypothetical protein BV497_05100 [Fulvimonas soli]
MRPSPSSVRRGRAVLFAAALVLAAGLVQATPGATLTRKDVTWLRRAGFGIDSAVLARYQALGRARYLDELLAGGDDTLPPAIQATIDSYPAVSTPPAELLAQYRGRQRQLKAMPDGDAKLAAKKALQRDGRELVKQAQQAELLRAVYGGNPLKEQMVWFWLNHFSVYGAKGRVRLLAADYEERVIRPHALGRFRDLVMATLKSPAMLEYLDNDKNAAGKVNENYARELMELHTLGVDAGYTQQDVQQLALILTGAGIAPPAPDGRPDARRRPAGAVREGLFLFNPRRHDFSDKTLLGRRIRGSGHAEIEQAVDLLTRQPACARFVSRQLAEYFLADRPPPALVDAMARTFQQSDGDIARVLRTLLASPEFAATGTRKFADPMRFLAAAMRLSLDGRPVADAAPLANWMAQLGEPPFGRITPDGWPLDGASWSGSGQMARRFDVAAAIGSGRNRLFVADGAPRTPPALDSPLFRRTLAPWLSPATRAALAKAGTAQEWNTYLLASPDFNYL